MQNGPVIRYTFSNPDTVLQLRLGESDSRLEEITSEGVEKIVGVEFNQKVRGTGITYEDLALKFIYWPNARLLSEDYIKTRRVLGAGAAAPWPAIAVFAGFPLVRAAKRRAHADGRVRLEWQTSPAL